MKSYITHIGKDAFEEAESMLVLFGEQATEMIRNVSVLQSFDEEESREQLREGHRILFGDNAYTIQHIGEQVNDNLSSLGHCVLIFKEKGEEDQLPNSIYLWPHQLPELAENMVISYQVIE